MTVAELIEKLSQLNPNEKVLIWDRYHEIFLTTHLYVFTEEEDKIIL